ncbi:reverse transcriptase domain-containing protein [Tanacetum coccineum]
MNNREATRRLAKWGVELEAYDIKYAPRSAIKGQVLADFLADTMTEDNPTQEDTNGPDDTLEEGEGRQEQETTATKAPENLKANAEVEKMHAFVDSKLVASQVEGSYEAKGEKTKKYKEKVLEMIRSFRNFRISHIPREENRKADALSKLATVQCEGLGKGVLIEELNERSVDMAEVNATVEEVTRT